jgi:vacuolar-type H+-ATPase subunit H
MDSKRDRARDLAEEGLDKMVEGNKEKGRQLIDEAKKIDPHGVEDLAEEVERDKEKAERFSNRK